METIQNFGLFLTNIDDVHADSLNLFSHVFSHNSVRPTTKQHANCENLSFARAEHDKQGFVAAFFMFHFLLTFLFYTTKCGFVRQPI